MDARPGFFRDSVVDEQAHGRRTGAPHLVFAASVAIVCAGVGGKPGWAIAGVGNDQWLGDGLTGQSGGWAETDPGPAQLGPGLTEFKIKPGVD